MTIGQFLRAATDRLNAAGIETARLDCLVLAEDVLGMDRAVILAHPEHKIAPLPLLELSNKVAQRAAQKPLAYIRRKASFYGREFKVSPAVLVPRPETEALIGLLKTLTLPHKPSIADIGTGSGCIGITAALELSGSKVCLCDIDPAAMRIARQNANSLGAPVKTAVCDLFGSLTGFDVVLANLPYVPTDYAINQAAKHEPKLAIFGGHDGLEIYRHFWQQAKALQPKWILTETLPVQHKTMAKLALDAGYKLSKTDGYAQLFSLLEQHPK